jgi:hypothetical protein
VNRRALLTLVLAPLGLLVAGRVHAQSVTQQNWKSYFRIEQQNGTDRKGRPTVSGYIYNDRGLGYAKVRLLTETLDSTGNPVAQQIDYVDTDVPLFNRGYFEVRPKTPGASYRVSIYSADWNRLGGT